MEALEELDCGNALTSINDRDPSPVFYDRWADGSAFESEGYTPEQRAVNQFVSERPNTSTTTRMD